MALLAEEIVEEWLNRQGYFTIRGIKLGVQEIDLLGIKRHEDGSMTLRHIEVQASINPQSYISKVPKSDQRKGIRSNSIKRSEQQFEEGVAEWIEKKYNLKVKKKLMQKLFPGEWSRELVVNLVTSKDELKRIRSHKITIHFLQDIISEMNSEDNPIKKATGGDFYDLINLGRQNAEQGAAANP